MSSDGTNRKYWQDQSSSLSRRINLGWFLQKLSAPLLVVSALGAVATLILRREFSEIPLWLIGVSLAACLVGTFVIALILAARRFEKPEQALVRIEAGAGLHSALSAANAGVSPWPEPPQRLTDSLKWHLPKTLAPPLAAVALLAVGLLVPISARQPAPPAPSSQPQAWSQIDSQLEQLAEDAMVDEEYIDEVEKRLEELRAQEEEEWFSHASLEATDSLEESHNANMEKLDRELSEAGSALEALAENADKLNAQQKQKLAEQFEQALEGLQNGAMKPNPELLGQLSKLNPNDLGKLNPDQMKQLKEGMQKLKDSLEKNKDRQGGQGEGDWEDQLLGDGEGEGEGEGKGEGEGEGEGQGNGEEGKGSGSGGVNRGPGHDPNVLRGGKDPLDVGELTGLNAEDLSRAIPGDLLQLQDGKHSVDESASKAAAGGAAAQGKGGDRVWRDSLAPEEQRALKKYFE
jgi:hypothetical protein